MKKKIFLKIIVIMVLLLFAVTAVVYAVGNLSSTANQDSGLSDAQRVDKISQTYGEEKDKIISLKSELGDWDKVNLRVARDKNIKRLSEEEVVGLYDKGYGIFDIKKAEDVASLCGKTPEEILQYKGKTAEFIVLKGNEENGTSQDNDKQTKQKTEGEILQSIDTVNDYTHDTSMKIEGTSKSWESVVNGIGIDTSSQAIKIGISEADINSMKSQGLTDNQIIDMAALADQYNKSYKEVWNDFKKGKKLDDLKSQYGEDIKGNSTTEDAPQSINDIRIKEKADFDKSVIEQCGITDDEISLCKQYRIDDVLQVAHAKDIAYRNRITLEQVLKMMKEKGSLQEVDRSLGGDSK